MTTDIGIKFKVETPAKEIYQQLLEFITIVEERHYGRYYVVR